MNDEYYNTRPTRFRTHKSQIARGIGDVSKLAHRVVRVSSVAHGLIPAIRQAVVGIIGVTQNHRAKLIEFIGHASILVVIPVGRLVLAICQREEVPGGVVGV